MKSHETTRWQVWRKLGILLCVLGGCSFFGGLGLFEHFQHTRPTNPIPEEGRTYQQDDHGKFVYLTQEEHTRVSSLIWGGWLVVACGSGVSGYSNHSQKS